MTQNVLPKSIANFLAFPTIANVENLLEWIVTAEKTTGIGLHHTQIAYIDKYLASIQATLHPNSVQKNLIDKIHIRIIQSISYPFSVKRASELKDTPKAFLSYLEQLPQNVRYTTLESIWERLNEETKTAVLEWGQNRLASSCFGFLHSFLNLINNESVSLGGWLLVKASPYPQIYKKFMRLFQIAYFEPFDKPLLRISQLPGHLRPLLTGSEHKEYIHLFLHGLKASLKINQIPILNNLNQLIATAPNQKTSFTELRALSRLETEFYQVEQQVSPMQAQPLRAIRNLLFKWFDEKYLPLYHNQEHLITPAFTFLGLIKNGSEVVIDKNSRQFWVDVSPENIITILSRIYTNGFTIQKIHAEATFYLLEMQTVPDFPEELAEFIFEVIHPILVESLKISSDRKVTVEQLLNGCAPATFCLSNWDDFKTKDYQAILKFFNHTPSSEALAAKIFLFTRIPFKTAAYLLKVLLDSGEDAAAYLDHFPLVKRLQVIDWFYHKVKTRPELDRFFETVLNDSSQEMHTYLYPFKSAHFFNLFAKMRSSSIQSDKKEGVYYYTSTLANYLHQLDKSGTKKAITQPHVETLVKEFLDNFSLLTKEMKKTTRLLFTGELSLDGKEVVPNSNEDKYYFWMELAPDLLDRLIR